MKGRLFSIAAMAAMMSGTNEAIYKGGEGANPIFSPKRHSKETYRSQQKRAKKKRFKK